MYPVGELPCIYLEIVVPSTLSQAWDHQWVLRTSFRRVELVPDSTQKVLDTTHHKFTSHRWPQRGQGAKRQDF